ncbi:universal stress protein UspE [Pleionea sediminis]|uniref:universal stress protein UspE n=1 Tax=Pleionea sediminis TaxID=2569479 RepID=UPI0013DDEE54|nr:universal stress protein UspE [Pleionea sediminis]
MTDESNGAQLMKTPQKLLVVITREKPFQPALDRALMFSRGGPIEITLFSAVYEPALELTAILASNERKLLRNEYIGQRQKYLEKLIKEKAQANVAFHPVVTWHKKTAQAVVEYTQENEFDLTIKRISSDANSQNPFVTPVDWHLLRFCHSPLLLVRDDSWKEDSAILAAVCPTTECTEHQKLNHDIIEYSQYLAEMLKTEAHVVNTHVSPALDAPSDFPNIDLKKLKSKVNQFHNEKMQELVAKHPYGDQHIHVVEGIPEEKIPALATRIGAQLVVMGTVGRTGLTAAFMGNTAERVLAQLNCEVLALKPDNFEV